jgi:hypothetical protein
MKTPMQEFVMASRQGLRLFFAPIVGVVEAVRRELGRMN